MKKVLILYLILVMFIPNNAHSQILYTDVIPDTTLTIINATTIPSYYFDINQDGTNDYRISLNAWHQFGSPTCCDCYSNSLIALDTNSKIAWRDTGVFNGPYCTEISLDSGLLINNRFKWFIGVQLNYYCPPMSIHCYQPATPKYYVLKFYYNNNFYFGWVRLQSDLYSVTIFDYAINLTPNQTFITGQIVASDTTISNPFQFNIQPNPTSGDFVITLPYYFLAEKNLTLCIYDITGKLIQREIMEVSEGEIKVRPLHKTKGIYNVTLSNNKKICSGRIILD